MIRSLLSAWCLLALPLCAAPKISVDNTVHDFGERNISQPVKHAFKVTNTGDAELKILQVEARCGCTAAQLDKGVLAPGESVDIIGTFDLKRFLGSISKALIVHSNDPVQPKVALVFKGTSVTEIEMNPPSVFFIPRKATEVTTQKTVITALKDPMDLKLKSWPKELFDVQLKTLKKGRSYELSVTNRPLPPGNLNMDVVLETGLPNQAEITLKLIGFLNAEKIAISRREIYLRKSQRKPVFVTIALRPSLVESFNIIKVETPHKSITGKVLKGAGGGYQVRLDGLMPLDEINGKPVIIHTDVKGRERIEIPIFIE